MRVQEGYALVVVEFPFVVGPLGSWDSAVSDKFLRDLEVPKRAIVALKRPCVTDEAIKFSRIIAYTHILGKRYVHSSP